MYRYMKNIHFSTNILSFKNITKQIVYSYKYKITNNINAIYNSKREINTSISEYITTPIFYINGNPHIGHLYTVLLADTYARWYKQNTLNTKDKKIDFLVGTDEHGNKVLDAYNNNKSISENKNSTLEEYCDAQSKNFKDMWDIFSIDYTTYNRTTDSKHIKNVQNIWKALYTKGYIYEGIYIGWYCRDEETFVPQTKIKYCNISNKYYTIDTNKLVEKLDEKTFFFRITTFKKDIENWLVSPDTIITPIKYKDMMLSNLNDMQDISISRPYNRVKWGINIPDSPDNIIYVWLDALCIYFKDYFSDKENIIWPPTLQIIGKDIVRFHCLFWPAILLALDIPLPKRIHIHGHWLVNNIKMSKSLNNVLHPKVLLKYLHHSDIVRYALLSIGNTVHDMSFISHQVVQRINNDLANGIGNLFLRITSKSLLSLYR